MPELRFQIRWPDGTRETCYSPSRIVKDHFDAGKSYALQDFLQISRTALLAASERVRQRYGAPCGRALSQIARLERASRAFAEETDAQVTIESFQDE